MILPPIFLIDVAVFHSSFAASSFSYSFFVFSFFFAFTWLRAFSSCCFWTTSNVSHLRFGEEEEEEKNCEKTLPFIFMWDTFNGGKQKTRKKYSRSGLVAPEPASGSSSKWWVSFATPIHAKQAYCWLT